MSPNAWSQDLIDIRRRTASPGLLAACMLVELQHSTSKPGLLSDRQLTGALLRLLLLAAAHRAAWPHIYEGAGLIRSPPCRRHIAPAGAAAAQRGRIGQQPARAALLLVSMSSLSLTPSPACLSSCPAIQAVGPQPASARAEVQQGDRRSSFPGAERASASSIWS